MARFEALAGWLNDRGVAAELLDRSDVRRHEPHVTDQAVGGLTIPSHAYVVAHEFTLALAAAARQAGAQLVGHGRVRHIARSGEDLVVALERESMATGAVILAGGSWSGQVHVEGAPAVPVRPVRGQLLHLAWSGPPLKRVTWGDHTYLVPWEDGSVLVGATMEEVGFDERTTAAGVRELLDAACALIPSVRDAEFLGARAGLRPATPDGLPIIGRSAAVPGLVYATGHFRNGVLLAPLTAMLVADLVLDDRSDPALERTRPQRFGDL
jgi:glycine oxidase